MMLLEYAVWGAWAAVAGKYFTEPPPRGLGLSGPFSGMLFSLAPLGAIISPLLVGQLADRWVRAERLQGVLCLLCAGALFLLGGVRDSSSLFWLMLALAIFFAPTTSLTNAIAFAHLKDPSREFGGVRVGGTIGWFIALGCLAGWRALADTPIQGDLFYLSAAFALTLGVFSFTLPATPPQHSGKALPFLDALGLFRQRNFLVFFAASFVLGLTLDFYYIFGSAYFGTPSALGGVGVSSEGIPTLLMLAQVSEIVVMATLGASLPRLGIKRALLIGFGCWVLRFVLLAAVPNVWGAAGALLLHGLCFTFVFAVASLYVHEHAPPAIRASAQALITVGLFGFGRFFGSHFSGWVHRWTTSELPQPHAADRALFTTQTNWVAFYSIPLCMTVVAAVIVLVLFKEPRRATT
jgi:nucleoside transporter